MTFENFVKARLVDFVMNESQGDPSLNCQLAIAQCLSNRVNAGWCGGDWLAVIDGAPDVTGTVYPERAPVNTREPSFRELLRRIDDVYYGAAESLISVESIDGDETIHPLYYCVGNNVNREWFKEHILSEPEAHRMVAQVGSLFFFM